MQKIYSAELPIRFRPEGNKHDHWAQKYKRARVHKMHLLAIKYDIPQVLPCIVRLTRKAPRMMDTDGWSTTCKAVRDGIADMIRPGLAPGRADAEGGGITFEYAQEKQSKKHSLLIEVFI